MKYKVIILFTFLTNFVFSQNFIEYSTDFGLVGDVKKIDEKNYSLALISGTDKNGKIFEQTKLGVHKWFTFNEKKLLTEEFVRRKNNHDLNCQYLYDENDSLIDIKYKNELSLNRRGNKKANYYKKKRLNRKVIREEYNATSLPNKSIYNSKGKLLEVYYKGWSYNSINISKCNLSYKNNILNSITCFDENENLFSIREYNKKVHKIFKDIYRIYINNRLNEKQIEFFDHKGDMIKKYSQTYINDTDMAISEFTYDNFHKLSNNTKKYINNTIKIEDTESKRNTIRKLFYEYDTNNNLTFYNRIEMKGDTIQHNNTERYFYDDKSNFLSFKKTFLGPNTDYSTTESHKYNYDSQGNWNIKCIAKNKWTQDVFIRQIEYYNSSLNKHIDKRKAILFCNPQYYENLEKMRKREEKAYKKGVIEIEENN